MKRSLLVILISILVLKADSQSVDTVIIYSKAMQKSFKCVVIQPFLEQDKPIRVPVVYLLHGYSGDFSNWIKKVPELQQYATEFKIMIVCPDGGYSSWYFDSPVDSSMRYETYIGKEVPAYIDSHYPTINDRKARAISGLSMGGHGGLFLGLRHPDLFGACGSMSGGVDLNFSRNKYDVSKRIGDTVTYADNWKKYSVINMVEKMPADTLKIIFDCGTEDFFYKNNQDLHKKMVNMKIPHEYIERPGAHNWQYWGNAVKYQLFFFRNFFNGR